MIWRQHIHKVVLRLPDSWSNWNLEMLVFEERGKAEYPEKNPSEQRREPTANSTLEFEPRPYWWEASALSTAPPLLPVFCLQIDQLIPEGGGGLISVIAYDRQFIHRVYISHCDQNCFKRASRKVVAISFPLSHQTHHHF